MAAPDLDALEAAITARLLALTNDAFDPPELLLRSVFNLEDEAMATDERLQIALPAVGILHEDEQWADDEILGTAVSHEGVEYWTFVILTDAPKRGGGIRGPRGVRKISSAIFESFDGWHITFGCPVAVKGRRHYHPRDESGELLPVGGQSMAITHPVSYQSQ